LENNVGRIGMNQPGWESYRLWLNKLRPSTAKTAGSNFRRWMDWVRAHGNKFSGFTPDQMIEHQRKANNEERYELLDLLQQYIGGLEGRPGYIRNQYNNVRSFFVHSRAELPADKFQVKGTVEAVMGKLEPDEIRKLILSCNQMYQAVYTAMFQAALGREEFIWWNTHGLEQLREDLKGDPQLIKITLPGRKKLRFEKPYYTFVTGDGVKLLKRWMAERENVIQLYRKRYGESYEDPGAIFIGQKGEPIGKLAISQVWSRRARRLGLLNHRGSGGAPRYGKSLHELRDSYRSLWEKTGAEKSVAEFCMGHTVDVYGYNKAHQDEDWVREEYLKAAPWLNIFSSGRPFNQVDKNEVELLRRELEEAKRELRAQLEQRSQREEAVAERLERLEKLFVSPPSKS